MKGKREAEPVRFEPVCNPGRDCSLAFVFNGAIIYGRDPVGGNQRAKGVGVPLPVSLHSGSSPPVSGALGLLGHSGRAHILNDPAGVV